MYALIRVGPFCTILLFCGDANEEQGIFSLLFKYPYIQADFTVCVAQMIPGKWCLLSGRQRLF